MKRIMAATTAVIMMAACAGGAAIWQKNRYAQPACSDVTSRAAIDSSMASHKGFVSELSAAGATLATEAHTECPGPDTYFVRVHYPVLQGEAVKNTLRHRPADLGFAVVVTPELQF